MKKSRSRPLWWMLRPLVGMAVALALVIGGLALFFPEECDQETEPGPIMELPVVIVPWSPDRWPAGEN